jgi:hypothetical protein
MTEIQVTTYVCYIFSGTGALHPSLCIKMMYTVYVYYISTSFYLVIYDLN